MEDPQSSLTNHKIQANNIQIVNLPINLLKLYNFVENHSLFKQVREHH